ncbi:MAG: thermonuclease family protein [Phreatobacter sp.]
MARWRSYRRPPANRAFTTFALAACVIAAGAGAYALRNVPARPIISGHARIIDGDSLVVAGTEVRLYGIDAPELFQRCTRDGKEVLCGREAARQLIALIAGQLVTCERRDIDRYGRTVALCRVDGVDLGRALVASGHAVSYGSYLQEEAGARAERKGVWAGQFIRPREWRDRERGRFAPGA